MQCPTSKKLINISFFFTLFTLISYQSVAQSSHRLAVADSLFKNKRYTQAFEQYETILHQNQYTPTMLLRMAYIQEGLNHIGQAMYFLNLYYIATNDKGTLNKMEQMAGKYHLEGYKTSDLDTFRSYYHDYYSTITLILTCIVVMLLIFTVYIRIKHQRRPIAGIVTLMIMLVIFVVHLNHDLNTTTAIITSNNTFVMDGPSAGAPLKSVVTEGHRVSITGHEDVWQRIDWQGHEAWVKENSLKKIEL